MELLTELLALNENKIVDRRLLGLIEKALKPLGPKITLTRVEEVRVGGRFHVQIEGEGNFEKVPNSAAIKKAEKALVELGFDEFLESGQTVMGAEIEFGKPNARFGPLEGEFTFIIELDQD
jgi:hypothetical protein